MMMMSSKSSTTSKQNHSLNLGQLGIGTMQWGTTMIDDTIVNPKGNLSETTIRDIWKTCRENDIGFFDTAEGKKKWFCFLAGLLFLF